MIIFAIILLPLCASYISSLFYIQENLSWHGYNSHAQVVSKQGWRPIIVFRELFLLWWHKSSLDCLQNIILITTQLQLCFSVICTTHVKFIYWLLSWFWSDTQSVFIIYMCAIFPKLGCILFEDWFSNIFFIKLIYSTWQNFTHNRLKKYVMSGKISFKLANHVSSCDLKHLILFLYQLDAE